LGARGVVSALSENIGEGEKMRKTLAVVCALALASLISATYAHHIPPAIPAPGFTLTDIDGNTFSLSDYIGKRVLLNFFFTT